MLYHPDDIPALKERLADAVGRRGVVVNRIAELRPITDPIERRCRSIKLATWALLYDRQPLDDGHWEPEDGRKTVSEAVALIDALKAPYGPELKEMAALRAEEARISKEVSEVQKALEAISERQAKARKKSPPKAGSGGLF
jgi:hypothetical protein